ncbi:MAG TPA: hypothetical protein VGK87_02775, partial [Anaerolineae bacterium]
LTSIDPELSGQVLAHEFISNPHPASVPRWNREIKPWLQLVARIRTKQPELGLPEFTDDEIERVLALAWGGAASFKEVVDRPLLPAFRAVLSTVQLAALH